MSVYDQNLANTATAVDQCMRLGGVALEPHKKPAGFNVELHQKLDPEAIARAMRFQDRSGGVR